MPLGATENYHWAIERPARFAAHGRSPSMRGLVGLQRAERGSQMPRRNRRPDFRDTIGKPFVVRVAAKLRADRFIADQPTADNPSPNSMGGHHA
jgi:hypothetical protein